MQLIYEIQTVKMYFGDSNSNAVVRPPYMTFY